MLRILPNGKLDIYFEEWDGSELRLSEEHLLLAATQTRTRKEFTTLLREVGVRIFKVKERGAGE